MSLVFLVGTASDFFDEYFEITRETLDDRVRLVPVDNMSTPLAKAVELAYPKWGEDGDGKFFMAVPGSPQIRELIVAEGESIGLAAGPPVIHPSASVSRSTTVGVGTMIGRLVSTGFGSAVGNSCHVNRSASIGHHCVIEDFVTIAPSATLLGSSHICQGSFI